MFFPPVSLVRHHRQNFESGCKTADDGTMFFFFFFCLLMTNQKAFAPLLLESTERNPLGDP